MIARKHLLRGQTVIGFLCRKAANDRQLFHLLGNGRQVLADLNAGHGCFDRLERAAIGMARLEVERVELARPALHPEQDA